MDVGTRIITFTHTHDAFAFEDAARTALLPGRIIPLPTGIAASCGLAWRWPAPGPGAPVGVPVPELPDLPHEGVYRYGDDGAYHRLDA